jgi:ADP-heptose:LPS heptosyltransferase
MRSRIIYLKRHEIEYFSYQATATACYYCASPVVGAAMSSGSKIKRSSVYLTFKRLWRRMREHRKAVQLIVARRLWDKPPSQEVLDPSKVSRVAVLRWDDKLGDTLMATLFVDALHKVRPDIEITYITGKQGKTLLHDWDAISELVIIERRGWKTAHSLGGISAGFDVVVELTSGMSAYELYALHRLKGNHYIGYDKHDYALFDVCVDDSERNFASRYLAAAALLTGKQVVGEFYLPSAVAAEPLVANYLADKPAASKKVLINLFAAGKHRSFAMPDAERFLRWWLDTWPAVQLMLLSVPGREEQLNQLVSVIDSPRLDRTPLPPSIELTVALVKASDLVFSPDTALVHIVAALDCPQIAVYREQGDEYEAWRPASARAHVLFNRPAGGRYDRTVAADFSWPDLRNKVDELLA